MDDENYEMYDIKNKIKSWNSNLVTVEKKRNRNGEIINKLVETPNPKKSKELIAKFMGTINETGFNGSVIDVRKLMVCESYEHFLYVRLGNTLYFLSERGIDEIINRIKNKERLYYIQQKASEYGIRKTAIHKRMLLDEILICFDDDPDFIVDELTDLTDKELTEKYENKI